jgi:flagellar basal body-associated protein FliL
LSLAIVRPYALSLSRRHETGLFPMITLIKIALVLFLIGWSGLGLWMLVKYDQLFGYHPDDPAESSGARALNVTQVSSVWFGFFAVAFYFLIR